MMLTLASRVGMNKAEKRNLHKKEFSCRFMSVPEIESQSYQKLALIEMDRVLNKKLFTLHIKGISLE